MKSEERKVKRKKVCPKCGRKLWLRDFYKDATKSAYTYCKDCAKTASKERYSRTLKKPDGVFWHKSFGSLMNHQGKSLGIFWNGNMLSLLKRHFPYTRNEEMANMLGVSPRTVIRKARELGLKKDPGFLHSVWEENRLLAVVATKRSEKSGYKKGHTPWNKGIRRVKN